MKIKVIQFQINVYIYSGLGFQHKISHIKMNFMKNQNLFNLIKNTNLSNKKANLMDQDLMSPTDFFSSPRFQNILRMDFDKEKDMLDESFSSVMRQIGCNTEFSELSKEEEEVNNATTDLMKRESTSEIACETMQECIANYIKQSPELKCTFQNLYEHVRERIAFLRKSDFSKYKGDIKKIVVGCLTSNDVFRVDEDGYWSIDEMKINTLKKNTRKKNLKRITVRQRGGKHKNSSTNHHNAPADVTIGDVTHSEINHIITNDKQTAKDVAKLLELELKELMKKPDCKHAITNLLANVKTKDNLPELLEKVQSEEKLIGVLAGYNFFKPIIKLWFDGFSCEINKNLMLKGVVANIYSNLKGLYSQSHKTE